MQVNIDGPVCTRDVGSLLTDESAVLRTFVAPAFENRAVALHVDKQGGLAIRSLPEIEDFSTMLANRKAAQARCYTPHALIEELHSPEGMRVANLGVSVALTTLISGQKFLVVVSQHRPDFGDTVLKLISGYVNGIGAETEKPNHGKVVVDAAKAELSEELVVRLGRTGQPGSQVLQGFLSGAHDLIARELLVTEPNTVVSGVLDAPRPTFLAPAHSAVLPYNPDLRFQISPNSFGLGALQSLRDAQPLVIDGVPYRDLGINISAVFKAAQAIVGYELKLPPGQALSISHAEHAPNPAVKNGLIERLRRDGAALLRLSQKGEPTGDVFTLREGELVPLGAKNILLSEAFLPSVRDLSGNRTGIVTGNNISMNELLGQVGGGAPRSLS